MEKFAHVMHRWEGLKEMYSILMDDLELISFLTTILYLELVNQFPVTVIPEAVMHLHPVAKTMDILLLCAIILTMAMPS